MDRHKRKSIEVVIDKGKVKDVVFSNDLIKDKTFTVTVIDGESELDYESVDCEFSHNQEKDSDYAYQGLERARKEYDKLVNKTRNALVQRGRGKYIKQGKAVVDVMKEKDPEVYEENFTNWLEGEVKAGRAPKRLLNE